MQQLEDMSMYAQEDKTSAFLLEANKLGDLQGLAKKSSSNLNNNSKDQRSTKDSTTEQDPVVQILEKSKKLTEKQIKYTKAYRKQQAALNEVSYSSLQKNISSLSI